MTAVSKKEKKFRIRHLLWVRKWWRKLLCPTLLTTLLMRYTADSVWSWYSSLVAALERQQRQPGTCPLGTVYSKTCTSTGLSPRHRNRRAFLCSLTSSAMKLTSLHSPACYLMCEFGQRDHTKDSYENHWILPEISVLEKQGSSKKISLFLQDLAPGSTPDLQFRHYLRM